ncbi:MAG: hypothetical protein CMH27_06370 [Micavibrio sp.]|nr:hypothetical protein [Micavibrio sp.]
MILTCPKCTTRFLLSAFVLAPDGRKVKCSSCGETWFQLPDPEELRENFEDKPQEIPDSVKPIPKGSNVPAVKNDDTGTAPNTIGGAIAAAIVFVLVAAVLLFLNKPIVNAWPPSHVVYKAFGIDVRLPGQGLVFDKMRATAGRDGKIVISGSIINLTNQEVRVPMMAVDIRGDTGETLAQALIEPASPSVEAEGVMALGASLMDVEGASEVFLRFVLPGGESVNQSAVSKIALEDDGNTPAPHADETAHPNAHAGSEESPPHVSAPPHQESSH